MADALRVTHRLLQMFFHERFGIGPHVWMLRLRMKDAVGMLGSGMTVKTVADKVGYKQASHFSREFKRFFGVPPAEYVFAEIRGGDGKVIRPFRF